MAHRSISSFETDAEVFAEGRASSMARLDASRLDLLRPKRSWLVGALGVVLLATVGWWLLRPSAAPIDSALPLAGRADAATAGPRASGDASGAAATGPTGSSSGAVATSTSSTSVPEVVVQAAGQVQRPGVYRMGPGDRVDDLVSKAGGFTAKADVDRVNLAAPLADGERVWVPSQGEDAPPPVVAGSGGGASASGTSGGGAGAGPTAGGAPAPTGPVDLNTATAEELDSLPGVGPATAAAILGYRTEHGRFSSVDDLLDVRGIGDAKLEQLRPLVTV